MIEMNLKELGLVNGGGLTLVEALTYTAGLMVAGPYLGLAAAMIVIVEYNDYKDGI